MPHGKGSLISQPGSDDLCEASRIVRVIGLPREGTPEVEDVAVGVPDFEAAEVVGVVFDAPEELDLAGG